MTQEIKVGFCVAYDWDYLRISLPLVYPYADRICLSVDKDRISWAGNKFPFDETAFYDYVRQIDIEGKIALFEDDFHLPELRPMENEVRQRNLMGRFLGEGGWHVQLDTDEYMLDFEGFAQYLRGYWPPRPVNVVCPGYVMFKKIESGYLFVEADRIEYIPVATTHPNYEYGRRNRYFEVRTNYLTLHQSWARSEQEILEKINNWGHKEDFGVHKYFQLWQSLNENNYQELKNFHPTQPELWKSLTLIKETDLTKLFDNLRKNTPKQINALQLLIANSIWVSRLRALVKKCFG